MFLLGLYNLYSHRLFVLVIVRFDHLSEGSATQTFHQLVPISHLFVFPPHVVALEIVLPWPCSHSDVVNCLLVDQLDLLVLRKQGREPLENFLSRQSWEGSSKSILLQEI